MNGFTPRQTVYSRRQLLRTIQRREPHHARIGALAPHPRPTASGEVTYYRGTIATECPRCPSRRDCKRTSLWLAEVETMVISGGASHSAIRPSMMSSFRRAVDGWRVKVGSMPGARPGAAGC